jgi:hypothetical protein
MTPHFQTTNFAKFVESATGMPGVSKFTKLKEYAKETISALTANKSLREIPMNRKTDLHQTPDLLKQSTKQISPSSSGTNA